MTRERRLYEIRAILSDHAQIQHSLSRAIFRTLDLTTANIRTLAHMMTHCEMAQADEIDRLYSKDKHLVVTCDFCQRRTLNEFCDCETLAASVEKQS